MRKSPSTTAQRAYIEALAYETRTPSQEYGPIDTFDAASAAIDYLRNLRRRQWSGLTMSPDMRKAIFSALRKAGRTKEDLYAAMRIESLAEAKRPSILLGRRCLQWIKGEALEPDYAEAATSVAEAWASFTRPEYPRPSRPDGYVPLDPLLPDPVFDLDPEPVAMPDPVTPPVATVTPRHPTGRPGFTPHAQPRRITQPVVTTAAAAAPAPVVAKPPQPIRRPMGRPGMPARPVAQPATQPVAASPPTSAVEDKPEAVAEPERPFVPSPNTPPRRFEPKPLPAVDEKGLSAVELMTRKRLALLNTLITTQDGVDFLVRIARENLPAWQKLEQEWTHDIPF